MAESSKVFSWLIARFVAERMRVCRAGRKPGVEPAVVLHGFPKANHPPRFNHMPPIDSLPFGFGISHVRIFSGQWRNVEKETGGGISNSFKPEPCN
jgi:hypothetical protein